MRSTTRSYHRRPTPLAFNATPLVDMIFTLSIFFMLVTRFSSAEQVPMQLPQPDQSQAAMVKLPARVIINCRVGGDPSGPPVLYSIGPNQPEPLGVIANRLAVLKQQTPAIQVVVRADRRLPYADVRAVMRVIAEQDIDVLNVVAHVHEGQ